MGRRLLLTSDGEQLLGDSQGILTYAHALGEHAQALRRGNVGVLRVSAAPHLLEGIFPVLLRRFAARYPNVHVRPTDAVGAESFAMLARGELNLVQSAASAFPPDEQRFASHPLAPMQMLAAFHPSLRLGKNGEVEIHRLAPYPLLHATTEFLMRRHFDAACRMAGFTPNYVLECRAPHALLAMAEAKHGVAIIPSALRVHRYTLRRIPVMFRGKSIDEPLSMFWDKRRPLPAYAKVFCEMVAEDVQRAFPIKRQPRPAPL